MKEIVKKAESFITFDKPLEAAYISAQFSITHNLHKQEFPNWGYGSTRQKLISAYWLKHVLQHWLFIYCISAVIVLAIQPASLLSRLPGVLLGGLLVLPLLLLSHYWPNYSCNFLPKLEMIKEDLEAQQNEKLEKCRQAQLSNFALTLIFYVFDKTSTINSLQCHDQFAGLLTKLYGVDTGSMKKNLELLLGKKRPLPARKYTEIRNRFDEACAFFEELQFEKGVRMLRELEARFQAVNI